MLSDKTGDWRNPVALLIAMTVALNLGYATWQALLNNFAVQMADFSGAEIGIVQSLREIPGLLAFTAIFFLLIFREQRFAILSLIVLGIGTAITGFFPSLIGLSLTVLVMSFGFHYFETMVQSLSLQWLPKQNAAEQLGRIMAAGSIATIFAYALIFITWTWLDLDFVYVYLTGGAVTIAIALYCWVAFPQFEQPVAQHTKIILRKRYWLYYALTFFSGARRQIFVVFAGFLMVQKFGFSVAELTALYLGTAMFKFLFAAKIGALIGKWGERRSLIFEYSGLVCVFTAYAFASEPWMGAALFLIDHMFYALMIAMKTYFQKIADPRDLAPSAGVAYSINHIAAIVLPVTLGAIWLINPAYVFLTGVVFAAVSLALAFMMPREPGPGREFIWSKPDLRQARPAE